MRIVFLFCISRVFEVVAHVAIFWRAKRDNFEFRKANDLGSSCPYSNFKILVSEKSCVWGAGRLQGGPVEVFSPMNSGPGCFHHGSHQ